MGLWKAVLAVAVVMMMALWPVGPEVMEAPATVEQKPLEMARLMLEKAVPATGASRSPVSAYTVAQKPLRGMRICVDPGHGGQARWDKVLYTGGTVGVATGQTESDVNLRVSLILREYLRSAGAEVIMTRIDDERVTCGWGDKDDELDCRRNMANGKNADLFISVHHNEGTNRGTNYGAVFYPSGTANSVSLADNIASACGKYMGMENIGAKAGSYRVFHGLRMPGVIVEASFMSCHEEDKRLISLAYNKLEAKGIATGILNYVRLSKGRQVDFSTIFAPIDDRAGNAQAIADASFVRRQIVERKSLFGVRYEEITYDATGNVVGVRTVGSDKPARKSVLGKLKDGARKSSGKIVSAAKSGSKSLKSAEKSQSKSEARTTSRSETKGDSKVSSKTNSKNSSKSSSTSSAKSSSSKAGSKSSSQSDSKSSTKGTSSKSAKSKA